MTGIPGCVRSANKTAPRFRLTTVPGGTGMRSGAVCDVCLFCVLYDASMPLQHDTHIVDTDSAAMIQIGAAVTYVRSYSTCLT